MSKEASWMGVGVSPNTPSDWRFEREVASVAATNSKSDPVQLEEMLGSRQT